MSKRATTSADLLESRAVRLRILDKEVQIACKPGEEDDLNQAAAHVDKAMRELRQRNTTSGIEKIAIVTAINTAHDLLKSRARQTDSDTFTRRLSSLNNQLDELLRNNNN